MRILKKLLQLIGRPPTPSVAPPKRAPAPASARVRLRTPPRPGLTPEERRRQGIDESIYLHSERWDELLVTNDEGLPPLRFREHNGRLWFEETSSGKLVKVANRKLASLGIWSAQLRGSGYYPEAVGATDVRPFAPVDLVREPDNEHDKNSIAVKSPAGTIGYFNKQMAARLSRRLDAGDEVIAFISSWGSPINVVAASPEVMSHLRRAQR